VALSLHHDGYEWVPSNEQYAWGRTDLRFTMRKGLAVELLVVAADGGAPVEDWQTRVFPQPGTRSMTSSDDFRVRTKGHHDGGRAVVTGVSRGKQFVVVEPKGDEFAVSACAPVEVADPGPARVTVSLSRNATRPLHVQSADGAPVAAALVRLADPNGNAVTPRLQVATIEQWGWNGCRSALQLQETTTDARGDAVLRGPQDRPLALFLPGPGHVPTAVADVSLATPEPLVVTVATGARLVGKVVPAAALAELRRQAGLPTTAGIDKTTAHMQPSVALRRTESGLQVEHPDGQHRATIGEDGAFEINGAPPGTWQVAVNWFVKHGEGMAFGASEECAAVDLRDGTTTSIEVDLSRLLPGTLDGLVLHNGAPLADTAVQVVCNFGRDALGNDRSVEQQVRTDADGRFHFLARAGACTVAWARQRGDQSYRLRAAGTVDVVAGQTVAQTFLLTTGTARVRLLDAQGGPAAKVAIELRDAAGAVRQVLPPTGDDGCTSGETEAETFTATVLPKRLQDPVAQRQVWLDNPGNSDPFAALRLRLGNVAPTAGATAAVELHLPASWDR
jgi:hypothetical protein